MSRLRSSLLLVAALALVLGIGTLSAFAAGPTNTSPTAAAIMDNQAHTIQPNSTLWYRFDYAGDRSAVSITLLNGANGQVAFNVLTPQQIGDWTNAKPIGRGTVYRLNCNSNQPTPESQCTSNDLRWDGQFPFAGTYYVEVINNGPAAANPQLVIQGTGVTLASQTTASPATAPNYRGGAAAPAPATSAPGAVQGNNATNLDPGHAAILDNAAHAIPANSTRWYRFDYAGDKSAVTITLVNGANGPVAFNVYTPGQIDSWWNDSPIGRGTALTVNCTTNQPAPEGQCTTNDLTWTGQFNMPGTYYVEVVNNGSGTASPQLVINGSGVTLSQQSTTGTSTTSNSSSGTTGAVPVTGSTTTQGNTSASGSTGNNAAQGNTSGNTSTGSNSAQGNAGVNLSPAAAAMLDNRAHTIQSGTTLWYRFDYAGDRSPVSITLWNGANGQVAFNVYTPQQIGDWTNTRPIGRGTVYSLNCNSNQPAPQGQCTSNDLHWDGQFPFAGTYYVEVINYGPAAANPQLVIQGSGVTLGK